jgi:hypothetical protein
VTGQPRDDGAAGRIEGFLAAHDRLVPGVTRDFVSACTPTGQSHPDGPVLTRSDLREVLRELDEARKQIADLRTENEGLFLSYSTEKSRHELASEAFDEVRGERDKLSDRIRILEHAAEPRCDAMGPPSLCGDEGRPLGPCELGPGHRNPYHRNSDGWWSDDPQPAAAGSPRHDEGAEGATQTCGAPVPDEMALLAVGGCLGETGHNGPHQWLYRRDDVQAVLTPEAWCDRYGLETRGDGWNQHGAFTYDIPITLPEFWRRFGASTSKIPTREQYDRILADLKAATPDGSGT